MQDISYSQNYFGQSRTLSEYAPHVQPFFENIEDNVLGVSFNILLKVEEICCTGAC